MENKKSLTPILIFKELSRKVIGQEEAKKSMSIAIATHHCRLNDSSIEKSNILLIGPTGTGKTEMARTLAKIAGVPFTVVDATTLTAHGYIGEDVEICLHQLLMASDYNQKAAEEGIIFIDEIDKLARGQEGSVDNGIATVRVQQSLLKMMEGGMVKLTKPQTNGKSTEKEYINFNTSKVLFICSGAFPGLENIINYNKNTIGINTEHTEDKEIKEVKPTHLIKYGMIPEFLGRLPVIAQTEELTEENLMDILRKVDNSLLEQYKKLMKAYGIELNFDLTFLKLVVKESVENKLGARGLRAILENKLKDLMFSCPQEAPAKVTVTKDGWNIQKEFKEKKEKKQNAITEIINAPESQVSQLVAEDRKSAKARAKN